MHERVAQEVAEHLAQLVGVAEHGGAAVGVERDLAVGGGRARVVDGVAGERGDVELVVRRVGHLVEPREREQVLDEHAHPRGLVLDAAHRALLLGTLGHGAHAEQLRVAADRRQRRAQLVRGVGDERAQPVLARLAAGEGVLEPVEHAVERRPEPADLRAGIGRLDPVGEVAARDPAGGVAHAVERQQADPHDDPAGAAEQQQHGGDHDALDHQQPLELLVGLAHRDGGDQGPAGPRVALGEHAVAAVVAAGGEQAPDRHAVRAASAWR